MAHQELGRAVLDRLLAEVAGKGVVEGVPQLQGNRMAIIITPAPSK
jgi:translation initiation factor IF-3